LNATIATSALSKGLVAVSVFALVGMTGCTRAAKPEAVSTANLVTANDLGVNRIIGEGKQSYQILGRTAFDKGISSKQILPVTSALAKQRLRALAEEIAPAAEGENGVVVPAVEEEPQLLLGFPIQLLGEYQMFGGVITAASDAENEDIGRLKLTDLPPLHVKPIVVRASETAYVMALMGCANQCSEGSQLVPLITFPVVGVDEKSQSVILDLAPLGKELNLLQMMDPEGEATHLTTKTSVTKAFDYSLSTLVFDVETTMVPVAEENEPITPEIAPEPEGADVHTANASAVKETVFNVRWYLRLGSTFNPAFESRSAAPGVGFFMTDRSASSRITRFSRSVMGGLGQVSGPVNYYIKDVPKEYQAAFKSAFDKWNETFVKTTGAPIISYEFIDASDPRHALLIPGDIRYNIVAWDLVNKAPYGGLGPSIANQYTGETLSANVLIQGPSVVNIYTKWFDASTRANELRAAGNEDAADKLLAKTMREIRKSVPVSKAAKPFALKMGNRLDFRVTSQLPELSDPLFDERLDFEEVPAGFTYPQYMEGYFHEMLAHELGHNLGLRHNFRGNLSDDNSHKPGSVSHSIMEYLGRGFRHINDISKYDVMAIAYGYLGTPVNQQGMYCTDEDVADADNLAGSPECSRDDATADPYGFFEARVAKAVKLLLEPGKNTAPVWTLKDLDKDLTTAVNGLALYAARAEATAASWTNFFNADRPTDAKLVKAYTLSRLSAQVCSPKFAEIVAAKEGDEAKAKTLANIEGLKAKVKAILEPLKLNDAPELVCE